MLLRCFGEIRLEESSFKQKTPLLLLAYSALKGVRMRSELRDVFWPYQHEEELQQKNLSEALRRLRGVDKFIIRNDTKDTLVVKVKTDVEAFIDAYEAGAFEEAVALYEGPFLEGVERETKLNLGVELEEWILSERERLHDFYLEAQLRLALSKARSSFFDEAADLAWQVFLQREGISYPTPFDFKRIVLLLSAAAEFKKISKVVGEAKKLYDGINLEYSATEAKERIAGVFGLPVVNDLFVGRDKELVALQGMLKRSSKQVTLLGLGGVGKTELGVALGHAFKDEFVDGVYYLKLDNGFWDSLERLMDSDERASLEGVKQFFRDKACLFILDNAESNSILAKQLVLALADCPEVRVLVTSRETLGVAKETLFFLKGLDYPEDALELKDSRGPAVDLFVSHAERLGVEVSHEQLADVLRICSCVQGHPLSLVLASSWTSSLSVAAIAEALEESLFGLSEDAQVSLRETIKRSLTALSGDLYKKLLSLALFPEPFELQEAQNVIKITMFDVKHLIDASLLHFDAKSNTYSFHPVIKAYCQNNLENEDQLKTKVHASFAEYYLISLQNSNLNDAQDIKTQASQKEALIKAWQYAVKLNKQDLITTSLNSLSSLFGSQGWQEDSLKLINQAQGQLDKDTLRRLQGKLKLELGLYTEATELLVGSKDAEGLALLALAYSFENRFDEASKTLEQAKNLCTHLESADLQLSEAILHIRQGFIDESLSALERLRGISNIHLSLACNYYLAKAYALKQEFNKATATLGAALNKTEHYHLPYWQAKLTLLKAKQQYYQDDWQALQETLNTIKTLNLNHYDSIDKSLLETALDINNGSLRTAKETLMQLLKQCLSADQKIHLLYIQLQLHIITQDPKENPLGNFLTKNKNSTESRLLKTPTTQTQDDSWQHLNTDDVLWLYKGKQQENKNCQ